MRSSQDEKLESGGLDGAAEESTRRARHPGGKALRRLLHFLVPRGYDEAANTTIDAATHPEEQEALRSSIGLSSPQGFTVAAPPHATLPEVTAAIAKAYIAAAQPSGAPTGSGPQWRSLGPTTIPNGQTYGASRVNVSGRVAAIAVDPGNGAHVLCGAAAGGIWESFDRGGSWAPRSDFSSSLAVGALAFDQTRPGIAYCGTGEGNFYWSLGAGVLKSSDGGTTWTQLCTAPFVGQGFYDLKIDPANSQHMLSANTYGVYETSDGGATWMQRRSIISAWSISIAPGGGAGAEILAACEDGLWKSTDGGMTWNNVPLPGAPATFARLAVAHAPRNAGFVYVFGSGGSTSPHTAYLWRRTSAAGAFSAFAPPAALNTSQDWYDWFLAVAPDSDAQIYIGAIDSWRGDLSGANWTWTALSNKGATGDSIHPDQHAITFEPGNPAMVYIGCDGGLFRSPDRGVTWQSCNNGLVITEFEYIAQNVGSSRWLIGGTQDNGTERYTGNPAWTHVMDGDGGDCAVNHDSPDIVFAEYYGISPQISTQDGDWTTFRGLSPSVPANEGSLFYCPYTCSANGGNTLALGTAALYVSRDNGTTWTRLTFPSAATASALYVPGPDAVYVGTTDGRILHTNWNGSAWSTLSAMTTPRAGANTSSIYVGANNANILIVSYSTINGGRVFVSTNGGSSWTDRSTGLPALPVNVVEADSRNSNRIWVGTDLGVYQSLDLGATWTNFSNGLPNVLIGDLLFHPDAWVLRAGTRSRGVWEIPVDGWMTAPACGRQFTGSLTAHQTQSWYTFNWPATWHVVWTVMPTTIDASGAQIELTVRVQRASNEFVTYWLVVQNLTAQTVAFEGRFCILSRY